jgi:hypothetical protein
MVQSSKFEKADFASLRVAFETLSEIYALNGKAKPVAAGVKISSIPRDAWARLFPLSSQHGPMMKYLIQGAGQRSSLTGRREVMLAVIAHDGADGRYFEATALLVKGRGIILDALTVRSSDEGWREKLQSFTTWDEIDAVLPASEGNNQRAMIGLVLQLAGIGRGKLTLVEAELPKEAEEVAQMVKGADWMKAGLPRFTSSAAEALWYLMRLRSVHARMIRERKQGYYTSIALGALYASGLSFSEIAEATGMSEGFVEKLTPKPGDFKVKGSRLTDLGEAFQELDVKGDERRLFCAGRVWKGAAIYAHMLDKRVRDGLEARKRVAEGQDLISVAEQLSIARRDLVRILSVRQDAAVAEKIRFVSSIIEPDIIRRALKS